MWRLVGIMVSLICAVMGNLANDSDYYLTETSDDGALGTIEKSVYDNFELKNAEPTNVNEYNDEESENQAIDDAIVNHGAKRSWENDVPEQQVPAPLAALVYWPEEGDKVVRMKQQIYPPMRQRRYPMFSPRVGKRGVQSSSKTITTRRSVRVPFYSWGGKRDGQRQGFFSWGGKRDGERQRFFSWGGKRKGKKQGFFSWGGKRAYANDDWDSQNDASRIFEADDK